MAMSCKEMGERRAMEEKRLRTFAQEEEEEHGVIDNANTEAKSEENREDKVEEKEIESKEPEEDADDGGSFFDSDSDSGDVRGTGDGGEEEEETPEIPQKVPRSQIEQYIMYRRLFQVHARVPGVGEAIDDSDHGWTSLMDEAPSTVQGAVVAETGTRDKPGHTPAPLSGASVASSVTHATQASLSVPRVAEGGPDSEAVCTTSTSGTAITGASSGTSGAGNKVSQTKGLSNSTDAKPATLVDVDPLDDHYKTQKDKEYFDRKAKEQGRTLRGMKKDLEGHKYVY